MSTLIQFRVSGEDEKAILEAARHAGMRPADYVRHAAKLSANRPDTALDRIERRLAALEDKQAHPGSASAINGPATLIKGMDASELILAVRRETRQGVSAFLVLLDGEPLPDLPESD